MYIGNLSFSVNSEKLKEIFSSFNPESAEVILYRDGRSKGFGFVTVPDDMSEKAKEEMNQKEVEGRTIIVNDATPFDPDKPKKRFNDRKRFDRRERNEDRDYQESF